MGTTSVDEFLTHWGVKGMKWGVRNDRKKSSSGSGKSVGTNNKRPNAHELSDEELQKHVARMELEQRYSKLAHPDKVKSRGEGKAFAKELGKGLVKTAVSAAGTAAVQKALKAGMLSEKK